MAVRAVALALLFTTPAIGWGFGLRAAIALVPPHRAHPSAAALTPALRTRVERELRANPPRTVNEAVSFALAQTDRLLRFGLSHHTSMRFDDAAREGHCVEYAHLLAAMFALAARAGGLDARAEVMRSDATLFGVRLPRTRRCAITTGCA